MNINLLLGLIFFMLFAWDMEHTRNFITWIYLFVSVFNLMIFFAMVTADFMVKMLKEYFDDQK